MGGAGRQEAHTHLGNSSGLPLVGGARLLAVACIDGITPFFRV